uniref:Secreted protein n=1 Tax=Heterorhabditis bacteriophora TaxID=37862 RepID=A0A1I7WE18_HETBA
MSLEKILYCSKFAFRCVAIVRLLPSCNSLLHDSWLVRQMLEADSGVSADDNCQEDIQSTRNAVKRRF